MDDLEAVLKQSLDSAQTELEAAEIALIEATAVAESARSRVDRLKAAYGAITGEVPAAAPSEPRRTPKPKESDNNPLAQAKCVGCGSKGTMSETLITAPSGVPVRMLVCSQCGNQVL